MSFTTIGDLSQSFQLRRDNARLKEEMQRLTTELSTGRTADLRGTTRGDFRPLAALERSVALLGAFRTSNAEAALFAEVAQGALADVEAGAGSLSATALIARTSAVPAQIDAVGREATQQFEAAVARLNVQAAGRTVFAGLATDGPALRPGAEILDALETAVAGATTAADVASALDAWFAPGGAYETFAFTGNPEPLRAFRVSGSESVDFAVTALAPEVRGTLRGMAMAALLDRGILSGSVAERAALAGASGEALIAARDGLVGLRAVVGDAEAAIERARVRNEAELSAAELARAALVEADPFRAAADLQAVQGQLEALYAVTARLSQLSLTSFLR
jgi:flagellar hook-associated protein 3 FlgL